MNEKPGVVPADSKAIVGVHEVVANSGRVLRFELCRLSDPRRRGNDVYVRLRVFLQEGEHWDLLPMRLELGSRLLLRWFTQWPPENLVSVRFDSSIEFEFRDNLIWEVPVLPFGLDAESVWRAKWNDRRSSWSLRRVRRIGKIQPVELLSL